MIYNEVSFNSSFDSADRKRIRELERKLKEEQEELAFYMMRCDDQKEELDKFKALFTPGQIKMITTGKRVGV